MKWICGVVTVPARRDNLLPQTLESLEQAGFPEPRLFVDGTKPTVQYDLGLEVTHHVPKLKMGGNHLLAFWELLLRGTSETGSSHAYYYALFEDDILCVKNIRQYLEQCKYPDRGYWNLYSTEQTLKKAAKAGIQKGWYVSTQLGKGALGIVMNLQALQAFVTTPYLARSPCGRKSCNSVDGVIVEAMKQQGWKEYVHTPSLLKHAGELSSRLKRTSRFPTGEGFPGVDFDALSFAGEPKSSELLTKDGKAKAWVRAALGCVERRRRQAVVDKGEFVES